MCRPRQQCRALRNSPIRGRAAIEGAHNGRAVGLNGTGDTLNNTPFTKQSRQAMLERLGVNIRGQEIRTGNVAAVMVTADLPPFATQGAPIDVTASAMGDAKGLQDGTLLVTPLLGRRQYLCGGAGLAGHRPLPGRG